jgi:hypothetical protein
MEQSSNFICQFGANFIDGRIKCYGGERWARYVRGNTNVGINNFTEYGDMIVDAATGLEWMKYDTGHYGIGTNEDGSFNTDGDGTLEWPDALDFCETFELGEYSDWRLPDAHELQSIVDYDRSPDYTDSAAIDAVFQTTAITNEVGEGETDYAWYWSSTTHFDGMPLGSAAVYVAFGRATGNMSSTPMDVHGAGAQRSESKVGPVPDPNYRGPQGDFLRIWNMARCVRGSSSKSPDAPASCVAHTSAPTATATTEYPTKSPSSERGIPNFIIMQPDDLEFFEEWTPHAHFDSSEIVDYPSDSDANNCYS